MNNMFDIDTLPGTEGLFDIFKKKSKSQPVDIKTAKLLEKASISAIEKTKQKIKDDKSTSLALTHKVIEGVKRIKAESMTVDNLGIILTSLSSSYISINGHVTSEVEKGVYYLETETESYIGPFKEIPDVATFVHNAGVKYALAFEQCMQAEINKIPELKGIIIGVKKGSGKVRSFTDKNETHELPITHTVFYYTAIKSGYNVKAGAESINDIGFDLSLF